jgi:hypothetical protein
LAVSVQDWLTRFSQRRTTASSSAWIAPLLGLAHSTGQGPNIAVIELNKSAAFKTARQQHSAVTYANQTANRMTHGFKHAPHFTVAAF